MAALSDVDMITQESYQRLRGSFVLEVSERSST